MRKQDHSRPAARRRHRTTHAPAPNSLYRRPLRYEPLEDRRLLATVTVTTLGDTIDFNDGLTSLREAIFATNLVGGADTIDFAPSLTASGLATIALTQGELKITDSLTIAGPGANLLAIDASGSDPTPTFKDGRGSRVFNIDDGSSTLQMDVMITGMTLTGGDSARGGDAISSNEDLTLIGLISKSNFTRGGGHVIFQAGGSLQLIDSEIIGSSSDGNAIATTNSAVLIQNSTITFTSGNAFTGTLFAEGGTVDISHSSFSGNSGSAAIMVWNGSLHIDHSVISQNLNGIVARNSDVSITDSAISNNGSSLRYSSYSGGVDIFGGSLLVERSVVTNNTTPYGQGGGGISTGQAQVTIVDSQFTNNQAASGSAIKIREGTARIFGSTLVGNVVTNPSSSTAGALSSISASLEIRDCTITENTIAVVNRLAYGLAVIASSLDTITVENTTISDNLAGAYFSVLGGLVSIKNSSINDNAYAGVRATLSDLASLQIADSAISGSLAGYWGGLYVEMHPDATTQMTGCEISNNAAFHAGGGIFAKGGTLTIDHSSVHNNIVKQPPNQGSGAIDSTANTRITNSSISNNIGGGIRASGPALSIANCVISGNTTTGSGGGIAAASPSITIASCSITGNSAGKDGGGLSLSSSGAIEILGTIISGNTAGSGGGGASVTVNTRSAALNVQQSMIEKNLAGRSGGGIYKFGAGSVSLAATTISGNTAAANGGGIAADGARATNYYFGNSTHIRECTVSGNTAGALGGGIWTRLADDIEYSTIASNTANAAGGGIFSSYGPLTLDHTIAAANWAPSGRDVTGLVGASIAANFSLIGSNAGSGLAPAPVGSPDANGNMIGGTILWTGINSQLGPLADNGGFTLPDGSHILTHALLAGSPAIDAGDPAAAMGGNGVPVHDQRGAPFIRVYGGRIDIGAIESQPAALLGDYNADGVVNAADYVVWRKAMGSNSTLQADGNGDGQVNDTDRLVWRANFGQAAASPTVATSSKHIASAPALFELQARSSPARRAVFAAARPSEFRPSVSRHVLAAVAANNSGVRRPAAAAVEPRASAPCDEQTLARRDLLAAIDDAFAAFAAPGV